MFFVFIIPILFLVAAFYFFKHKVSLLEAIIQLAIPCLFIFGFKSCATISLTSDTEYWNNTVTKVEYFEAWDEWIDETCWEDCNCTTDDDGFESCDSCPYDC